MTESRRDIPAGLRIDAEAELAAVAEWLAATVRGAGKRRVVMGLSGGVDSATAAMVAARALGPKNVVLISMPYGGVSSARHAASAPASLDDARATAEGLPDAEWRTIDIAAAVDAAAEATGLHAMLGADPSDARAVLALGNLKARQRAVTLYTLANLMGDTLVLGTENRTENLLGYFTVHGDAASDLEVLSPFLKTEIWQIAAASGVPPAVIDKAPSADLWPGQTDEGELGFTYAEADAVLAHYYPAFGEERPRAGSPPEGISPGIVAAVLARVDATAWKRAPKPVYPGRGR
ncbi:MAG TPA: NAD(+) synthase [Longimicrobium sp.]